MGPANRRTAGRRRNEVDSKTEFLMYTADNLDLRLRQLRRETQDSDSRQTEGRLELAHELITLIRETREYIYDLEERVKELEDRRN